MSLGIACLPLPRGAKRPAFKKWTEFRLKESEIYDYFQIDSNIGALWGKPSGGLIDIDLDCDEAITIARYILPSTFMYGRGKRPHSHYVYRCRDALTHKWQDDNNEMIIELRADGTQSVLPPSLHPDDDRFEIEDDRDFHIIDFRSLIKLANRIAALSLIARNYPSSGGRHDYISAVAGALSRTSMSDTEMLTCCEAVLAASGGREDDIQQRVRTIKSTIAKLKTSRTYGWPKLGEYFTSQLTFSKIKAWCESRDSVVPVSVGGAQTSNTMSVPPLFMEPPGLIGDLMKWCARRSYVRQPMMDLAAAFMCMSMVSMNRYVVGGRFRTALAPFMMSLAPTAGGKDSALGSVYEFCRRMRLGDQCFRGFQSYQSMLDRLASPPNIACWLWDEAGRKLKSAGRAAGSQDFQVLTWVIDLYGKGASHVPGLTARGMAIEALENPFLAVMASSQPAMLIEAVNAVELNSGLINRFLMFDAGDEAAEINRQRDDIFPARIETLAKIIRDRPAREGDSPFHSIEFDNDAYQLICEFEDMAQQRANQAEVWGRANQNALILAGLLALGSGGDRVRIDRTCAVWAIEFVKFSIARWSKRLEGIGSTRHEVELKGVEKIIADAKRYAARFKGNKNELLKRGLMPRSCLMRVSNGRITARELDAICDYLIDAEIIASNREHDMLVYWRIES